MDNVPSANPTWDDTAPITTSEIPTQGMSAPTGSEPTWDSTFDPEEKYGSLGQQAIAGLEGVAQGVAGPIATAIETKGLGIKPEDIQQRQEVNPITHGLGQAAGLIASTAAVPGLGAGMELAGKAATEALGLAAPVAFAERVGSAAVKGAVETALFQASDEGTKMMLDPNLSAEQAVANIGMAGALGAGGGALIAGAVSPLWKATVGNKAEAFLGGLKDHLNGFGKTLPEDMAKAEQTLGIQLAPELKAANISERGTEMYNDLKSSQHEAIKAAETNLKRDTSESVAQSLGRPIEEFQNYDVATAGREGMDNFVKEYKAKAEPIIKDFNSLTEPFKNAEVMDSDIADLSNNVVKTASERGWLGQDVPQQKLVDAVLGRLPSVKTALDVKRLMTTIDNIASENPQAFYGAAKQLKSLVLEAQQNVLGRAIETESPGLFEKYVAARKAYADLAKMSNEAGAQLSIGKFTGPEGFLGKLLEKRSPEEFFKKLSPEGNAEIIPFLKEHFPETLNAVIDNEFKKIVAPAVRAAKEGMAINIGTLQNAIEKKLAGQQAYARLVLPEEVINKTEAANYLLKKAIPSIKDSGTAGWLEKKFKGIPAGALGAIGWMTGHNPMVAALVGAAGELVQKNAPEAMKLAMLRFISSDQPIKSEAFKAMVDFTHNAIKANGIIEKATKNVFIPSAQVLASSQMPNTSDNSKLEKTLEKYEKAPDSMMNIAKGDVGHYLPDHQTSLSQTLTTQVKYLQSLKPRPFKAGPLDKEIEPSQAEVARYNKALTIANQPASVMERVKSGTIQPTDVQDLKALYPSLYGKMCQQLSNQMTNRVSEEEPIPYKTRMGISLFLGQPIDTSMSPMSIMSAQPKPTQQNQQQNTARPSQSGLKELNKGAKSYMTPLQASEEHKASKK